MTSSLRRKLRGFGTAIAIAVLPIGAFSILPAAAQVPAGIPGIPNMGEAYPLTPELVAGWVESFPSVYALSEELADRFDVPEGETPAGGLAAYANVAGAAAEMNAAVVQYGFEDYGQWINVMFSVITAYALVSEGLPPEAAAMMLTAFGQTQENLDAVADQLEAVAGIVDNL